MNYASPVQIAPLGTHHDEDVQDEWVPGLSLMWLDSYLVRHTKEPVEVDQGWVAFCRTCHTPDFKYVHPTTKDARHWFAWHAVSTGHTVWDPIKVEVRVRS